MKKGESRLRKRAGIGVIAAALLLGGCSEAGSDFTAGEPSVAGEYEEHLDISIAYWQIDNAMEMRDEDDVLKRIEKKFNVTIVPQNVTWDDFHNKISLWAETGQLPDLFVGSFRTEGTYYNWVQNGLLHGIPDDLSQYPNLERYMDSPEAETCMVDGVKYCIFRQTYSEQAETAKDRTICYRWDLAQKAGITEEPQNWDEFREMIQAIIREDPEGKGISGMTSRGFSMLVGPLLTYSVPLGSTGGSIFYWVREGRQYVPALFAGEVLGSDALATWQLVRDMYEEGTIEPDIVMTTVSQAEEKFLMGKSAAICVDGGIGNTRTYENIISYWEAEHGSSFLEDVRFLRQMPSVTGETYFPMWDYAWSESYINANVDDGKLDRILSIYDYLLSEEGTLLSNFGIEGVTYALDENGKVKRLTEEFPSDIYPSIELFASLVCWNYGNMDPAIYPNTVPEEYVQVDNMRVEEARGCSVPEYDYNYTKVFYQMGSSFSIDLNNIFQRIMVSKKPVEEIWGEIMEEYKELGLLEIIEAVNARVEEGGE